MTFFVFFPAPTGAGIITPHLFTLSLYRLLFLLDLFSTAKNEGLLTDGLKLSYFLGTSDLDPEEFLDRL
jgi:hypothetical protein